MTARRRLAPSRLVAASFGLAACTTTITPPLEVEQPAGVGVLDHGHHASLILEREDGAMVRYSYGDWTWYAMERMGPLDATAALFWPTPAALGRKRLPGPFSPAAVDDGVRVKIEHAHYLTVEAEDVRRLSQQLERMFEDGADRLVESELRDLAFVPHPEPYSLGHNSNRVVADWLEVLGCRVDGPTVLSDWQLEPPRAVDGKRAGQNAAGLRRSPGAAGPLGRRSAPAPGSDGRSAIRRTRFPG